MSEKQIVDLFYRRASSYDSTEWVTNTDILKAHLSAIPLSVSTILDVGTGTGVLGLYLHMSGKSITGIDLSGEMLTRASARLTNLIRANCVALPFADGTFDGVIIRQVLHYLGESDRRMSIREAFRVSRSGGVVLVSQITPVSSEDRSYWERIKKIRQPLRQWSPTVDDIADLLQTQAFSSISIYQVEHVERLQRWLERNPSYLARSQELIEHYKNAPKTYKDWHVLSIEKNDVIIREMWSLVVGYK